MELTESEALRAYARMLNTLDVQAFEGLLAEDFVYESLASKEAFLDYIEPKLQTVASAGATVHAEVGTVDAYGGNRPCVVLAQDDPSNLLAVVLAKVEGGVEAAERSGEYPR